MNYTAVFQDEHANIMKIKVWIWAETAEDQEGSLIMYVCICLKFTF